MVHNYLKEFENPSSAFRGAPFWAWNCKLDKEEVLRQLDYFKKMGMGGATIHSRTGLDTEYMGEEFMLIVKACIEKAKALNMKICLYDEDRWPSGTAGGKVTEEERFRSRYLLFTPFKKSGSNGCHLLGRYAITLERGVLTDYHLLQEDESGENVWYAYLEISETTPWHNNQAYVNTLDKQAIQRFIEITHEKYYKEIGGEFSQSIPSIFTDEPQFVCKNTLVKAEEKKEIIIPYTDDFEQTYRDQYGDSFLAHLPEVFWELPNEKFSLTRYRYHDHLTERFASAYADTIGEWCQAHQIQLTGHMMAESTLGSQTKMSGEAMRHYRSFQIPGIDMLCDWREYATVKQAQSASHQLGSNKVLSELYGVTNWDFDFRGHKLQGDWQAALGVTERVHHLSWLSMAGEAKRDYPASISYQSPWYEKYHLIETYFARVNTALQSGRPDVKIGVIHPIESFWLYFGPQDHTSDKQAKLHDQFNQIIEWLLFGLVDFDFISESLMEDLKDLEDTTQSGFTVGKMHYDVILVPGCVTLRKTTLDRLKVFADKGGQVIFVGRTPTHVDVVESQEVLEFTKQAIQIDFDKQSILNALEPYRQINMIDEKGMRSSRYISQLRTLGNDKILFIANGKLPNNLDDPQGVIYTIGIKGEYNLILLNALNGTKEALTSICKDGWTYLEKEFFAEDSVLLYLEKRKHTYQNVILKTLEKKNVKQTTYLTDVVSYQCSEPNVLLLDQAEYALDDEKFWAKEEVLRIDNLLRKRLNYPLKMGRHVQPYTEKPEQLETHQLRLRYTFQADLHVSQVYLAMEDVEQANISLNGVAINSIPTGYFVDRCIKVVSLPDIEKGKNELVVTLPYTRKTNLEWCYLLGAFGVEVYGNKARLVASPKEIGFTDIVGQKFPFYGGNFTYHCEIEVEEGEYVLEINKYRATLLSVKLDGKDIGDIIFEPYCLPLGQLKGKHSIEITAYGNRVNTFGPVHLCNESTWIGPPAWRREDNSYSYEYQLKRFGILAAPKLNKL